MDIERIRKTWTEGGDAFLIVRKLPVIHKGRATKSWRGHSHSCDNSRYLFYIGLMLLLLSVLCYLYKSFSEKAMAPHSSSLSWKIPWMEEPGRLQSRGSRSWTRLSNFTFTFHFHALEKEMSTHSSVRVWRIPGMGKPGGLPSMESHRVGHDWSDLA